MTVFPPPSKSDTKQYACLRLGRTHFSNNAVRAILNLVPDVVNSSSCQVFHNNQLCRDYYLSLPATLNLSQLRSIFYKSLSVIATFRLFFLQRLVVAPAVVTLDGIPRFSTGETVRQQNQIKPGHPI